MGHLTIKFNNIKSNSLGLLSIGLSEVDLLHSQCFLRQTYFIHTVIRSIIVFKETSWVKNATFTTSAIKCSILYTLILQLLSSNYFSVNSIVYELDAAGTLMLTFISTIKSRSTLSTLLSKVNLRHPYCYQRQTFFISSAIRGESTSSILLSEVDLLHPQCYQMQTYFIHTAIRGRSTSSTVLSEVDLLHPQCYQTMTYFINTAIRGKSTSSTLLSEVDLLHPQCYQR